MSTTTNAQPTYGTTGSTRTIDTMFAITIREFFTQHIHDYHFTMCDLPEGHYSNCFNINAHTTYHSYHLTLSCDCYNSHNCPSSRRITHIITKTVPIEYEQ